MSLRATPPWAEERGNLQLLWGSHLEIATVACGNLAMTVAAFFNSLLMTGR
jgi:hypothetical protein